MLDLLQHPKTVAFVLLAPQLILRHISARKNRSNLPLPPGPKGYIGIGNLFNMPARNQEVEYSKLAQRYGVPFDLGIQPHTNQFVEDGVYDGYIIPKGTVVIGNAWYVLLLLHS